MSNSPVQATTPAAEGKKSAIAGERSKASLVIGSREQRHIPKAILLEEVGAQRYVTRTVLFTALALTTFIVWAAMARLEEVTSTEGQIVPSKSVQIIQHQDGGTISHFEAVEGQMVEKGQLLLKLDPSEIQADIQQSEARYWGLWIKGERFRAFAENRIPDFSTVPESWRSLVQDQSQALESQEVAREDASSVIQAQIAQTRSDINRIDKEMATARREIEVLTELTSIRTSLYERQYGSKILALDTKRALIVAQGNLSRLAEERQTSERSVNELEQRLKSLDSDLRRGATDEIGVSSNELAQVEELLGKLKERLSRTELRAPIKGIVQDLKYRTVGGVIAPGGTVMRIVPIDDIMEAEIKISTSDVGHITEGLPARIKVTTYDFMKYGVVEGKVTSVSKTSFFDEKNEPYFRGKIQLARPYVGAAEQKLQIIPGMTLLADVVTDEKTVLSYLLKPIVLAFKEGLRER